MIDFAIGLFSGALVSATVGGLIVTEVNRQWRRELHKTLERAQHEINMWREVSAHQNPRDPGENIGGEVEGVQVGVGEFFHLEGAKLVDPAIKTNNLNRANSGAQQET